MYLKKYCPIILLFISTILCNYCVFGQISLEANGSNAAALHSIGLKGYGVNVGVISARNVRSSHLAFNDSNGVHVFNFDYSGSGVNYAGGSVAGHDTWVAGSIGSRGWIGHVNDIGAAPECNIYSARVVSDSNGYSDIFIQNALNDLINNHNCRVFTLPLQFFDLADGASELTKMIDYYAYEKNIIFSLAAGNQLTGFTEISVCGDAYNGITTGALIDEPNDFYNRVGNLSLRGLTVDGRKKPDICSPGSRQVTPSIGSDVSYYTTVKDGATSFSIPQTAGIAALLLQYADGSAEPNDDKNIVIKAVIVNSAFPNIRNKSGGYTDPANRVWDPNRGYGRIDALKAYQTLSAGKITKAISTTAMKGWAYDMVRKNKEHKYYIAANKNERLILTVTWNRQIIKSGNNYNVVSSESDLDLLIKDPNGIIDYNDADTINNLIKIDLLIQSSGEYEIVLTNISDQINTYAFAFERLEPLTCDFNSDYIVNNKDLGHLAFDWLGSESGLETNLIADANVNNLDYRVFAENWMRKETRYYHP